MISARWASCKVKCGYIVKRYENKNVIFGFNLRFVLDIRVSSVVRVQIRFYDLVAMPASDHAVLIRSFVCVSCLRCGPDLKM